MGLDRVTITGADDSVEPAALADLAREFPFVEWGLLFSQKHQGAPRYPQRAWVERAIDAFAGRAALSAHLCGAYVRDFVCAGRFSWRDDDAWPSALFARVQLNFHGESHFASPRFAEYVRDAGFEFILQFDGKNDRWFEWMVRAGLASPLFDRSGGAGALPAQWPPRVGDAYCGYAGGLGPDNVAAQLDLIAAAAGRGTYWIDMERRVRTDDDAALDLAKVRAVLERCAPYVESRGYGHGV